MTCNKELQLSYAAKPLKISIVPIQYSVQLPLISFSTFSHNIFLASLIYAYPYLQPDSILPAALKRQTPRNATGRIKKLHRNYDVIPAKAEIQLALHVPGPLTARG
jgi:hypothetical protein